jgi:hypothetical protein
MQLLLHLDLLSYWRGSPTECQTHLCFFKRLIALWSSILCPKDEFETFHWRDCLVGECSNYGVETLKIFPFELILERLVVWCKISYITVGKTSEG